ncbi:MAG: Gfo/Idh/MocA family oxidoreductase [Candidatus Latescibacterota bacterium]|nr:Gfo/Idh/MocA family oxidoreductase [Candidatus Latescibacterota bacterium]
MTNIALLSAAHIHTRGFLEEISKRDDCSLVALWDDMADRGTRYAEEYGAAFSGDLDSVVGRQDVDAFIICAENTRHLPLLKAAIPVGKPIFCEKPFTALTADAAEALALIRAHDTIVHMGYFQPFDGVMQGVKRVIDSGGLGQITHARFRNAHHAAYGHWFDSEDLAWFSNPDLAGGGAFMDMGAHAVHLLRSFIGTVDSVTATIGNASGIYSAVDDHGIALFRFANGVLGTVEASWVQTGGIGGLEVTGSEGTLFNHPQLGYVVAAPGKDAQPVEEAPALPTRVERLLAAVRGEISREELNEDLQCSADAVAIIDACYASSSSGSWVNVEKLG